MRHLVTAMLLLVAAIHLLPLLGLPGGDALNRLYGIDASEPNLAILMRHRAVLFGLLGAFLAYAAFRPALRGLALLAGYVSVLSFFWLAWSVGGFNAQVQRVVTADIVALVALLIATVAHWRTMRRDANS